MEKKELPMGKPMRVLDIGCGRGKVFFAAKSRANGRRLEYVGIDADRWHDSFPAGKEGGKVIIRKLNTELPKLFSQELAGIFRGMKFDEVHFHLPSMLPSSGHGEKFLSTVAGRLEDGGRIYQIMDVAGSSPIAGNGLEAVKTCYLPGEALCIYRLNEGYLENLAHNAGLRLEKYGMKHGEKWLVGSLQENGGRAKNYAAVCERYEKTIEAHSDYGSFARHFFVMKKV